MRIYDGKIELDPERVKRFFEARGRALDPAHPLTSVLYQDGNPALAEARDAHEKAEVLPLLRPTATDSVLDLGCGIGRWADVLAHQVARYHGVDVSASLVEQARSRHEGSHATFQQLGVEHVTPATLQVASGFTRVVVAGVLMYLNDEQVEQAMRGAAECTAREAMVYVREPVGLAHRLTLKEFWSDELNSEYNAIYRTQDELSELFTRTLIARGFELRMERDLYPDELNNRPETRQRIFLFERA